MLFVHYIEHYIEHEGAGEADADWIGDTIIEGAGDGSDLKLVVVLYSRITLSHYQWKLIQFTFYVSLYLQ